MATDPLHAKRRRNALAGLAVCALAIGAIVGAGAGDEEPPPPPPGFCDTATVAVAAGQKVMVRMEAAATPELLRRAEAGEIGGVVLFPPSEIRGERLAGEIERLQAAAERGAKPPLLVAIDQEGGVVERLPALAPQLSPYTLAENDNPASARLEGRATGFQLRGLGINVNLAPVLDVPSSEEHFMTPRAFGRTPKAVSRIGLAFLKGQTTEPIASTAKHFPGLGRAAENTDFAPTTVTAGRRALEADMEPFAEAVSRGIELVMLSSASYPALGTERPAVFEPAVARDLLRGELGFDGVTVSDDLLAPAISTSTPARAAALAASQAGTDVLLFAARDVSGIAGELAKAAGSGALAEADVRESCARIVALKDDLGERAAAALSEAGP